MPRRHNRQGCRFFFQAEDGIRDYKVTGVQTCALPIFNSGQIDGAWVPEPWATCLVQEGGGKVLVDEKTLWPGGQYVTTHLIVRTDYLQAHQIGRASCRERV